MQANFNNYREELENKLHEINNDTCDILKKAEQSIFCINSCLSQIKENLKQNDFGSQEEEILFFKEIKPSIYSKLIFLSKYLKS